MSGDVAREADSLLAGRGPSDHVVSHRCEALLKLGGMSASSSTTITFFMQCSEYVRSLVWSYILKADAGSRKTLPAADMQKAGPLLIGQDGIVKDDQQSGFFNIKKRKSVKYLL
jgi:hypothetical protein